MKDIIIDNTNALSPQSATNKRNSAALTRSLDSVPPLQLSGEASAASKTYLRDAAEHLLTWMQRMKSQEISPANVNAVCNLAQQIATIVKVNIEVKKVGL